MPRRHISASVKSREASSKQSKHDHDTAKWAINQLVDLEQTSQVANMRTEASKPLTNGTGPECSMMEAIQFSMALPNAPGSRIHTHLTILATCILVFCTSTTAEFSTAPVPSLGSFVYAMPDVCVTQTPYSKFPTLTFATTALQSLGTAQHSSVHAPLKSRLCGSTG